MSDPLDPEENEIPPYRDEEACRPAFEVGDTVRLRAGGPIMVVCYAESRALVCSWFWHGRYYRNCFHRGTLMRAELHAES